MGYEDEETIQITALKQATPFTQRLYHQQALTDHLVAYSGLYTKL